MSLKEMSLKEIEFVVERKRLQYIFEIQASARTVKEAITREKQAKKVYYEALTELKKSQMQII